MDVWHLMTNLFSPIENTIMIYILYKMFGSKLSKRAFMTYTVVFLISCFAVAKLFLDGPNMMFLGTIVGTLLYIVFVFVVLGGKKHTKAMYCVFMMSNFVLFAQVFYQIFRILFGLSVHELLNQSDQFSLILFLFSRTAFFFYMLKISKLFNVVDMSLDKEDRRLIIFLYLASAASNFTIYAVMNRSNDDNIINVLLIFNMLSTISVNLYLLHTINKNNKKSKIIREYELVNYQFNAYKNNLEQSTATAEDAARVTHDCKNQLLNVYTLIDTGDSEAAKTYITETLGNYSVVDRKRICENPYLNSALINARKSCIDNGVKIKFSILGKMPDTESIAASMILDNLIDNAVEYLASSEADGKNIFVRLQTMDSIIMGYVENPISGSVLANNSRLNTTKSEPGHGIGLVSVNRVAENYGGSVKYREFDEKFVAEFTLMV